MGAGDIDTRNSTQAFVPLWTQSKCSLFVNDAHTDSIIKLAWVSERLPHLLFLVIYICAAATVR